MSEPKSTEIKFFLEEELTQYWEDEAGNTVVEGPSVIWLTVQPGTGTPYKLAPFRRMHGFDTANGTTTLEGEAHFRHRVDIALMQVLEEVLGKPLRRKQAEAEARASR